MNDKLLFVFTSTLAIAASVATYVTVRRHSTSSKQEEKPAFWGLYIKDSGHLIICRGTGEASRHRLIWNRETLEVSISNWETDLSFDAEFNIWRHIDNTEIFSNALSAIKALIASEPAQVQHCTLVTPYSLSEEHIQRFTLRLVSTGISDHVYHLPIHSAIVNGLGLPLNSGDVSSLAIVFPSGTSFIAAPEERSGSTKRKIYARKTTVAALISDMRKLEQIVLLENELVKPNDYTPYIRQETLDVIARGASLWAVRRGGGAPFWLSLGPKIGIVVLDCFGQRAIHTVLGDPANSHKTGQAVITTTLDQQTSVEVQILYNEKPLTSLALRGFPAMAAGEGKFIFTVAVVACGGDEFDAIFQIVDLMSGMRKSQKIVLKEGANLVTDHPAQISLLETQSPIRPVASDWDLLCFPDCQPTEIQ